MIFSNFSYISVVRLENVSNLADCKESLRVNLMNNRPHTRNLEAVNNEINDCFVSVGVAAFCGNFSCTAFKRLYQRVADFLRFVGDYHNGFRAVEAFNNEVDRFESRSVGDD